MSLLEEDGGWVSRSVAKRQRELELMRCHRSCNDFCTGFESALDMNDSGLGCMCASAETLSCYMPLRILKEGEIALYIFCGLEKTMVKSLPLLAEELKCHCEGNIVLEAWTKRVKCRVK